MNRRDFLIRLGLAVPAVKTIVSFGTGIWTPPLFWSGDPEQGGLGWVTEDRVGDHIPVGGDAVDRILLKMFQNKEIVELSHMPQPPDYSLYVALHTA